MPGAGGQLKKVYQQLIGGVASAEAASGTGDAIQMIKELVGKLTSTTDLGAMTGSATGSLGEQLKQIQDLLDKAVGTTDTAAMTGSASGSLAERLQYLSDNIPKGVRRLQGSGYLVIPAAAAGVTPSWGGSAWTNGSYVQVIASTAEAEYLLGIMLNFGDFSGPAWEAEFDIATGGAGSETVISTHPLQRRDVSSASGKAGSVAMVAMFPYPIAVATSTRIAIRVRMSASMATEGVKLIYCKQADLVAL